MLDVLISWVHSKTISTKNGIQGIIIKIQYIEKRADRDKKSLASFVYACIFTKKYKKDKTRISFHWLFINDTPPFPDHYI